MVYFSRASKILVDVRLLAATNKDLDGAIGRGEFRADLCDRLRKVVLQVPPLRERRDDVAMLVDHFLRGSAVRRGAGPVQIAPPGISMLERYGWPGNVRELEDAIDRGIPFAEGGQIRSGDLGLPGPDVDHAPGDMPSVASDRRLPPEMTRRQGEVFRLACALGAVRRRDVTAALRISGETARQELTALVRAGWLTRSGHGRGSRYAVTQDADR